MQLVLANEEDEYLNYFPEDEKHFQSYIDACWKLHSDVKCEWFKVENIRNQKEFAMAVPVGIKTFINSQIKPQGATAATSIVKIRLNILFLYLLLHVFKSFIIK